MKLRPLFLFPTLTVTLLTLTSCKPKASEASNSSASENSSSLSRYLLAEPPIHAVSVSQLFANPTPGTEVIVTGEVIGRLEPFVEGRAMVVLGDPSKITPCNRNPDDQCETPWDVCCDDPEVIKKSIATIQIVDEMNRPLKQGLKGLGGLRELSTLTVVGTIAEGSNDNNLLINASGIHVGAIGEAPVKPSVKESAPSAVNGPETKLEL